MVRCRELAAEHAADPGRRTGQRQLARELTALVHGDAEAAAAEAASAVLFGGPVADVDGAALAAVAAEVPTWAVGRTELSDGVDLVDVLVGTGLTASKGEARRAIEQGGATVNDRRAGPGERVGVDDLLDGRHVLVRRGKRSYAMLVADGP